MLQRLHEKLQEIRVALDDDAVFNVIGVILPAAHVERVLRDYYAGRLGEADMEDRLLRDVDEGRFRSICQNALEGLASKKFNLEMLIERRARAQERRLVPETISRFLSETAEQVSFPLKAVSSLPHTYDPGRTPTVLKRYESQPNWKLPALVTKYPRVSTDRETAEKNNLEWVTPGHPLFEALRRHTLTLSQEPFGKGACFHSLQHDKPARLDFYRARVVDGLGDVIHERLFAVEISDDGMSRLQEPGVVGNFNPAKPPKELPPVASVPELTEWLNQHALTPFLNEVREERVAEINRITDHINLSLTELLQKVDEEIGKADAEVEKKVAGAGGCQVYDVHEKNLGYDMTSLDLNSGELRLIEIKGIGETTGTVLLTPNERRVAQDRRDCYWLYVVTSCKSKPQLQEPVKDPCPLPMA